MVITSLIELIKKHQQIGRFVIAGGCAFAVNIVVLFWLTSIMHVYYLISTVCAFLVAFLVSFALQKFWTFREHSREHLHIQLPLYLMMQLSSLSLNTVLMYTLVEYLHIWYIFSQVIIALGLAGLSFLINRRYIFITR